MPGSSLLDRQVEKSRLPDGSIDYTKLKRLVVAAYNDKENDRRRADRASRLVTVELEQAARELEVQNLRFKAALDNMSQGLSLFDREGNLVVCNRRFAEILELPRNPCCIGARIDRILDNSAALARADDMDRRLLCAELEFANRGQGARVEQTWPDGRHISLVRTPVADGGFLDTITDITETRAAAARLTHMARHDALTDLPNRVMLREALVETIATASADSTAAILCLDLDRFKLVNDTLGHPIGDALLVAVAERLRSLVRQGDIVARLGGDEFAIIQRIRPTAAVPEALARRISTVVAEPYTIGGQRVQIGVSIGIEHIRSDTSDPDEMLRNADLALYKAKAAGGGYCVFEPAMHALASRRRQLELDLRSALDSEQFEVHYQPQVDISSGQINGFEALVRWRHPERGLVPPADFITLSEEVGLIDRLGAFVLRKACQEAASWPQPVMIAVNLSALQFRSGRLVGIVGAVLRETGLDPSRLELEITEGVMLTDSAGTLQQLRQLKLMGVHISLDDFGTGYSSLSYIRNFPFDKIKIDQSFVRELGASADSLAIIRAVAGLCSSLGITTTAEGVETDAQLRILTAEKCDTVQGFLFGKAVPAHELPALFVRAPYAYAA
jgi:diguanylate cyclase (GGDEF)-like protein